MASSLFATTTITHASMAGKRKRDFGDEDCTRGGGGGGGGMTLPEAQGNGRTMKRWRNKPREEEVYQYTLQKLFSAQSTTTTTYSQQSQAAAPQFAHARAHPALSASPKNPHPRVPSSVRNPFAAMAQTKSTVGGLFKFMQAGPVVGQVEVTCEDCDRAMEGDEDEARCVGCARRVCEGGCSIGRGDGGRVCLECAMK